MKTCGTASPSWRPESVGRSRSFCAISSPTPSTYRITGPPAVPPFTGGGGRLIGAGPRVVVEKLNAMQVAQRRCRPPTAASGFWGAPVAEVTCPTIERLLQPSPLRLGGSRETELSGGIAALNRVTGTAHDARSGEVVFAKDRFRRLQKARRTTPPVAPPGRVDRPHRRLPQGDADVADASADPRRGRRFFGISVITSPLRSAAMISPDCCPGARLRT